MRNLWRRCQRERLETNPCFPMLVPKMCYLPQWGTPELLVEPRYWRRINKQTNKQGRWTKHIDKTHCHLLFLRPLVYDICEVEIFWNLKIFCSNNYCVIHRKKSWCYKWVKLKGNVNDYASLILYIVVCENIRFSSLFAATGTLRMFSQAI